ncbi:MAG TPA: hypothetical protein VNY05_45630 [Candidatus Acidoferrales bacterium]|nr:hypothetical protein [Candidatus Acidoferrales bacterium]
MDNARKVYAATRDVWIGGGSWLEPHERLGLLTVAAGLRPFSLLNHLDKKQWEDTARLLAQFELTCAVFSADFDYELDVIGPDAAVQAYIEHELKYPLDGLGIWSAGEARSSVDLSELGSLLCYPSCCTAMDCRTKAHDHSVTLQQLIEDADEDPGEVKASLAAGRGALASTTGRQEWGKRLDLTRSMFPYAMHTACDECIQSAGESPTAKLSDLYRRLTLAVSDELDLMIRWACEICRLGPSGNDQG